MIFLYANQPLLARHGQYFAKTKNFVDFLGFIVRLESKAYVACPIKHVNDHFDLANYVVIDLPSRQVIELPFYSKRSLAPLVSIFSALKFWKHVRRLSGGCKKIVIGGPGPNSFLFWCSWLFPRETIYAFFIRGDTVRTVKEIYNGKLVYPFAMVLVSMFRSRIRGLLKSARAMVFVYGEALLSQYPADVSQQHVIAPLISDDWIDGAGASPRQANQGPLNVLFAGRLSQEKNILNLVRACALAKEDGRPFFLTVLGDGPLRYELKEMVWQLGLEHLVSLKGHVASGPMLMQAYDAHDLLCLPSLTEATPRVIVEAFARGCPVLASDVGSIRDMFPDAIMLMNKSDAPAVADAIKWCSCHRLELFEMAQRGRERIGNFLIEKNAEKVLSILHGGNQGVSD